MFWTIIINLIIILGLSFTRVPVIRKINGVLINLKPHTSVIKLSAKRGALLLADNHFFLFTQEANEQQPIASISKLMTAIIFLKNNPGWNKIYQITPADNILGGKLHLFLGERVTVRDLFYTSLVASDNGATMALSESTGLSEKKFVQEMNAEAKELGLINTHFTEPTGLSSGDYSTAREVALLAQAAFKRPEIRRATTLASYRYKTLGGRVKNIESTDYLLADPAKDSVKVLAGKTGYTDEAGYSFVGLLQGKSGPPMIAVVLHARSKNERFLQSEQLVNWALRSYNWSKIKQEIGW